MNTDFACSDWTGTEVRHDKSEMPLSRDHGVRAIRAALRDRVAGVRMDVSNDSKHLRIAYIPELREPRGSNVNVANKAFGVEVVEIGCPHNVARTLFRRGKQEDARFPAATKASATKLPDHLLPQAAVNLDARSAGPQPPTPTED